MRIRSTGLGKTELKCVVRRVEQKKKDTFLLHVDSVDPVRWHVRIILEPDDLFKIILQLFKLSNFLGALKLFFIRATAKPEGDW